ncbi:hypothetical protein CYLTODRAFT_12151 [Cylindrobasidium torrendii FP15055 ss-10]|uniref:Uncharacterized protein n=1 Tax=Cylindrobasidium torrendii FP15055 ss-10 TaxID=1314674 RepID=A0A0D7B9H0_9AGAR|nr:hypothetical protein CYLTODRAFT_12151 [Cylindrobasidium torrendii FP15055 ss-10]
MVSYNPGDILPNAQVAFPIDSASFDFNKHIEVPSISTTLAIPIKIRNQHNCRCQTANEASIMQTMNCLADPIKYPDVGPPLQPAYQYFQEDIDKLLASSSYRVSVGPLPTFLEEILVGIEVKRSQEKLADEKLDRDLRKAKEAEKLAKKKMQPLEGSLAAAKARPTDSFGNALLVIPEEMYQTTRLQIYLPLHFLSTTNIRLVSECPSILSVKHDYKPIPTSLDPDPSSVPVVLVEAMLKKWGAESALQFTDFFAYLTALGRAQQIMDRLAGPVPVDEDIYHIGREFSKHVDFFKSIPNIDIFWTKVFEWERSQARKILSNQPFSLLDYKTAAASFDMHFGAMAAPSFTSNKRLATVQLEAERPPKMPRSGLESQSDSFRGRPASSQNPSQNSAGHDSRFPTCLCCGGPHRIQEHPHSSTVDINNKPLFTTYKNGFLWTIGNPPGYSEPQRVCVHFNLRRCTKPHGQTVFLDICARCGGNHAALQAH